MSRVLEFDCLKCGACCVGAYDDGTGFADCTDADVAKMTRHTQARLVQLRHSAHRATPAVMTEDFGMVCKFLRGTPRQRVSCRIYATRPSACSKYKPGSNDCLAARSELGMEI